jgi:hypothetical protein
MKTLIRSSALVLLCATLAHAQEKPAQRAAEKPAAEKPAAQKAAEEKAASDPRRIVFGLSVRFDIAITDTAGGKPATKTVSLNVTSGGSGSIRSTGIIPGPDPNTSIGAKPVPLNVDVKNVSTMANGQVRATIVVEYQPYVENALRLPAEVTASSLAEFTNGVKTLILQAADPMSDRRTTIEVTATILK